MQDLSDVITIPFPILSPEASPLVSPDGRWVLYVTRRTSLEENIYRFSLWSIRSDGGGNSHALLNEVDGGTNWGPPFKFQWAPDSETIAILQSNSFSFLSPDPSVVGIVPENRSLDDIGIVTTFKFAPDGKSIAFLATRISDEQPSPQDAVEIEIAKIKVIDHYLQRYLASQVSPPFTSLYVLDLSGGYVEELTGDTMSVVTFGWARDSSSLLVSTADGSPGDFSGGEYKSIDRTTRTITSLDHSHSNVAWCTSPNGQWLATYPLERPWHFVPPAVVQASAVQSRFEEAGISGGREMFWSVDGDRLFFERSYRMGRHLFRLSHQDNEIARLTDELDEFNSGFTSGADLVAFVRETVTEPPDVYVSKLSSFQPKRLTRLNPKFEGIPNANVRRLSWRSPDDRWDIEGFLVLPLGYEKGHRYPLLVEVVGGPSMVMMSFSGGFHYSIPLFAANGYAVFVPNTRGRSGGYEEDFCNAISIEGNQCQGPFSDLMAGLDLVIEEGICDPERLGIMGHSYGGILTAFAITQTNRFKAASFHEGGVDMLSRLYMDGGNPDTMAFLRRITGYGSPYDPEELQRTLDDSSIYHMRNVRTPVLIEAGEHSGLAIHAAFLAHGLAHFGIPYEFRIEPRTGHVTTEPKLIEGARRRNLAWFDYWLLNKPYADIEKQKLYDQWRIGGSVPQAAKRGKRRLL